MLAPLNTSCDDVGRKPEGFAKSGLLGELPDGIVGMRGHGQPTARNGFGAGLCAS